MLVTPFTTIAQENKISNNLTDEPDIEDDCDICPTVSVISKLVDEEDNKDVSKRFNEYLQVYSDLKSYIPIQGPPICKLLLIMLGINLLGGVILDLIFLPLRLLPFHILFNLLSPIYYYFGDIFGDNVRNIADIAWDNDCDWALPSLTIR